MSKYIDADQIRAEIERLEGENNCGTSDFIESKRIAYKQVKEALDSLPEQPVEGLEEAAYNFALHYDNGTCDGIAQDCFIAGAEWVKAKMLEEAVEADVYTFEDRTGASCAEFVVKMPTKNLGDKVRVIVIKEDTK